MELVMKGKAWKFGDDLDVDEHIAPQCGIFYRLSSEGYHEAEKAWYTPPHNLIKHFMEGVDPDFSSKVKKGDIVVAGKNFGSGHGHVTGAFAPKYAGVGIIAEDFYRQFLRHAIDVGLPILACKDITKKVENGDELEVNFETGEIKNLTRGELIKTDPFPEPLMQILKAGGLIAFLRACKT